MYIYRIYRNLSNKKICNIHFLVLNFRKKFNAKSIKIEAQVYAKELYEKVGFVQKSESFLEDGIPHVLMQYTE